MDHSRSGLVDAPPARNPRGPGLDAARGLTPTCPSCRGRLEADRCESCRREFPPVAGILDLRLRSDRYLDLPDERQRAEELAELAAEPGMDVLGLTRAYYDLTGDPRRERFLAHVVTAEARSEGILDRLAAPATWRILEVGCGTGGLLASAARRGIRIVGVDIASRWLVVARRRLSDHAITVPVYAADAERLPWPDDAFDAIVADSLIEHLDDPCAAVQEFARVLRPGGRLLLWSPNRRSLLSDPHTGPGGGFWRPRVLSPGEARDLLEPGDWESIAVGAPRMAEAFVRVQPPRLRRMIRGYHVARPVLAAIAPLWELRATRRG